MQVSWHLVDAALLSEAFRDALLDSHGADQPELSSGVGSAQLRQELTAPMIIRAILEESACRVMSCGGFFWSTKAYSKSASVLPADVGRHASFAAPCTKLALAKESHSLKRDSSKHSKSASLPVQHVTPLGRRNCLI